MKVLELGSRLKNERMRNECERKTWSKRVKHGLCGSVFIVEAGDVYRLWRRGNILNDDTDYGLFVLCPGCSSDVRVRWVPWHIDTTAKQWERRPVVANALPKTESP